jgi:hypothetical protein
MSENKVQVTNKTRAGLVFPVARKFGVTLLPGLNEIGESVWTAICAHKSGKALLDKGKIEGPAIAVNVIPAPESAEFFEADRAPSIAEPPKVLKVPKKKAVEIDG